MKEREKDLNRILSVLRNTMRTATLEPNQLEEFTKGVDALASALEFGDVQAVESAVNSICKVCLK